MTITMVTHNHHYMHTCTQMHIWHLQKLKYTYTQTIYLTSNNSYTSLLTQETDVRAPPYWGGSSSAGCTLRDSSTPYTHTQHICPHSMPQPHTQHTPHQTTHSLLTQVTPHQSSSHQMGPLDAVPLRLL